MQANSYDSILTHIVKIWFDLINWRFCSGRPRSHIWGSAQVSFCLNINRTIILRDRGKGILWSYHICQYIIGNLNESQMLLNRHLTFGSYSREGFVGILMQKNEFISSKEKPHKKCERWRWWWWRVCRTAVECHVYCVRYRCILDVLMKRWVQSLWKWIPKVLSWKFFHY